MRKTTNEEVRRNALQEAIFDIYESRLPKEGIDFYSIPNSVVIMIEVKSVQGNGEMELADLFTDKVYAPAFAPPRIAKRLRDGDVFLATLVFSEYYWAVVDLFGPYDTVVN